VAWRLGHSPGNLPSCSENMSGVVPSFILKAARAKHHFDEVEALVGAYGDRHPYVMRKGPAAQDNSCLHHLEFTEQPSDDIAIVAGDVVHNVRSGLNHLATALVPPEFRRKVQFPIFMRDPFELDPSTGALYADRAGDRGNWKRFTSGMPDGAVEFLVSVQPYSTFWEDPGSVDGLTIIEELSNNDKHRQLILLATGLIDGAITYTWPNGKTVTRHSFGDLRDGARDTVPMPAEVEVEIRGTPAIGVNIGPDPLRPERHALLELVGSLDKAIKVLDVLAITGLTPFLRATP
jgi:hypothetical protein